MVLTKTQLGVLGLFLAGLQIVNQAVLNAPQSVHTAIAIGLIVLGALGASTADATVLGSLIPHSIAVLLTTVAGVLVAVNLQVTGISNTLHGVIAAVVTLLATVGIKPGSIVAEAKPRSHAAHTTGHRG